MWMRHEAASDIRLTCLPWHTRQRTSASQWKLVLVIPFIQLMGNKMQRMAENVLVKRHLIYKLTYAGLKTGEDVQLLLVVYTFKTYNFVLLPKSNESYF